MSSTKTSRRDLLVGASATLLVGCDVRKPKEGLLGAFEQANERVERALFAPARPVRPSARDFTPKSSFPSYHISPDLPFAPAGWALAVRGMVERPMTFSLEDLQRMPRTDIRVRHHCVEGWSAVASWHGVRIAYLAKIVGAQPAARFVEAKSFDSDYWSSWDRESAEHADSMLAYGMNGEPLGPPHGGPVRLYGSVKLGYKMVKYLTEVSFLPQATGGYWEDLGYEWYGGV